MKKFIALLCALVLVHEGRTGPRFVILHNMTLKNEVMKTESEKTPEAFRFRRSVDYLIFAI